MNYTKPEVIAKNQPTGSFAAGCPEQDKGAGSRGCDYCERNY